jgi:hypothetical protein
VEFRGRIWKLNKGKAFFFVKIHQVKYEGLSLVS